MKIAKFAKRLPHAPGKLWTALRALRKAKPAQVRGRRGWYVTVKGRLDDD